MMAGVVLVLVLLAVGAFLILPKTSQKTVNEENMGMMADNTTTKTIRDLMAMTANQSCSFSDDMGNSGTLYSGGGSVRVDAQSMHDDAPVTSHLVSDGNYMYLWGDDSTEGMKMGINEIEEAQANTSSQYNTPKAFDVNESVNYECNPWSVDDTMFALPSNITFTDFSKMMEDAMNSMNDSVMEGTESNGNSDESMQAACAACDNLSGEAATQCRASLNCQ